MADDRLRAYADRNGVSWGHLRRVYDPVAGLYEVVEAVMQLTMSQRHIASRYIIAARKDNPDIHAGVIKRRVRDFGCGGPLPWAADAATLQKLLMHVGRRGPWNLAFQRWTEGKGTENFKRAYLDAPQDATSFKCFVSLCRHNFPCTPQGRRHYHAHMYKKHGSFKKQGNEPDEFWPQCSACARVYPTKQKAEDHRVVCPKEHGGVRVCGETSMFEAAYEPCGQYRGVEQVDRRCEKTFTSAKDYKAHLTAVHDGATARQIIHESICGKKKLVCGNNRNPNNPCTRTFATQKQLVRHRMACPQADKVTCMRCFKMSNNMMALRKHWKLCGARVARQKAGQ